MDGAATTTATVVAAYCRCVVHRNAGRRRVAAVRRRGPSLHRASSSRATTAALFVAAASPTLDRRVASSFSRSAGALLVAGIRFCVHRTHRLALCVHRARRLLRPRDNGARPCARACRRPARFPSPSLRAAARLHRASRHGQLGLRVVEIELAPPPLCLVASLNLHPPLVGPPRAALCFRADSSSWHWSPSIGSSSTEFRYHLRELPLDEKKWLDAVGEGKVAMWRWLVGKRLSQESGEYEGECTDAYPEEI
ncbi:hypothetical protein Scep_028044 [Stephania cephalantha]|uniref:Uncharacterized protein n=1 Tax=Stephania cephalantha TaxID=152367 RepID=A0AAP0HLE2_9MAGN